MSRRLIIEGADFSSNGILNVGVELENILNIDTALLTKASNTDHNWYFPSPTWQAPLVKGRTVYAITVRPVSSGNFDVVTLTGYSSDPSGTNTGTVTTIGTYHGTAGAITTIWFDEPIVVPDTGNVCFGIRPNGSAMYFYSSRAPILYYLTSLTGSWINTANYGGGFELMALVVDD